LTADRSADEAVIERVLAGDNEAFGALVDRYGERVHGAILRMIGNRDVAADLAQETLLRAFKGLRSFRHGSAFYTWLYAIAVNQVRSEFRRRGTAAGRPHASLDAASGEDDDPALDPPADGPAPEEEAARREESRRLREELARLEPEFREAVVLRDLEGLSYGEIAEATGVPAGTVRSRIHRGRALLRERLVRAGEPGAARGGG